ncbi:hypothetical protein [Undibacterium curvum]|uniref:hypothetical protein n=1 Tax=Undibacterium curvum TaxID=2762294 RepID=UPI003D0EB803
MANVFGNAYGLTVLSPIRNGLVAGREISHADLVRDLLQSWNQEFNSPMALVPETYLCRFFVLDDVVTESLPGGSAPDTWSDYLPVVPDGLRRSVMPVEEHLQSAYLVFTTNFHCGPSGEPDAYLRGMWEAINQRIREVWQHCYGFERVQDARSFTAYIRECQLKTSLFFVGSNDLPLAEQLKALYLKQEFARFATAHQGLPAAELRARYREFMHRVQAEHVQSPTWAPGQYRL